MKSDIVDIEGRIVGRTERAIRFEHDEDQEPVWLPLSQIEIDDSASLSVVSMPEWLATEKGLT